METSPSTISKEESDSLREWIHRLPDVTEAPHRFGGREYQVHGWEFMHFHGDAYLDIRLSKEDQARVLKEGKADRHLYAPQVGYVTFRIRSESDIETAKELIELAHKNARGIMQQYSERKRAQTSLDEGTRSTVS